MARQILSGDRELMRALDGIALVASAGLDTAARDSLEPMRQQTQTNALRLRQPGRSPIGGHLDQGVVVRKVAGKGRTMRVFWVAFQRRARKIAHLVEFGTLPHWQPKRMRMHPGARPKPFFSPAYEGTKNLVVNTLGQNTWRLIEGAALRFGRRKV